MKYFDFFVCFIIFLTVQYAAESLKTDCLEREKALAFLETAENLLKKAGVSFPSCEDDVNSKVDSECGSKKPLAYIEISKKLITDVRENFPTCASPEIIVQYNKSKDCSEILASGRNNSGVYTIWPSESNTTGKPLQVYCDMDTDGGGWTLIQRRGKYPIQQDFYQNWENYKNGFGNITTEFWLGNENIRVLCHKECEIRFDLQNEKGEKRFAVYKNFKLSGIDYKISINAYTGDAGDAMQHYNVMNFSTRDKGNTRVAEEQQSGWWHGGSDLCNLNGMYLPGQSGVKKVHWRAWSNNWLDNLASVEIKVKVK